MNDNNSEFSTYTRYVEIKLQLIAECVFHYNIIYNRFNHYASNIDIIFYTWPTLIILVSGALTPTFATSLRADTHSLNISDIVNMGSVYSGIRQRRLSVDWSMWLSNGEWPSRLEVFSAGRSAQPLLSWETLASEYPDSQKFLIK